MDGVQEKRQTSKTSDELAETRPGQLKENAPARDHANHAHRTGCCRQEKGSCTGEFENQIGHTLHFDTDSYSLNTEAQGILQKQAAWLQKYPQHTVTIEGHADERGTREYNLALGDRRATTVLNYLVALGVDKSRLSEVSYGKEKPICPDATDSCWNENRRGVTALNN